MVCPISIAVDLGSLIFECDDCRLIGRPSTAEMPDVLYVADAAAIADAIPCPKNRR